MTAAQWGRVSAAEVLASAADLIDAGGDPHGTSDRYVLVDGQHLSPSTRALWGGEVTWEDGTHDEFVEAFDAMVDEADFGDEFAITWDDGLLVLDRTED